LAIIFYWWNKFFLYNFKKRKIKKRKVYKMSTIDNKIKNELNVRKEILNKHLIKFNQLRNECRWSEAWNQLFITLNYANETLKYSANLFKNISQKMPNLDQKIQDRIGVLVEESKPKKKFVKKMIIIPKHQNIH